MLASVGGFSPFRVILASFDGLWLTVSISFPVPAFAAVPSRVSGFISVSLFSGQPWRFPFFLEA